MHTTYNLQSNASDSRSALSTYYFVPSNWSAIHSIHLSSSEFDLLSESRALLESTSDPEQLNLLTTRRSAIVEAKRLFVEKSDELLKSTTGVADHELRQSSRDELTKLQSDFERREWLVQEIKSIRKRLNQKGRDQTFLQKVFHWDGQDNGRTDEEVKFNIFYRLFRQQPITEIQLTFKCGGCSSLAPI